MTGRAGGRAPQRPAAIAAPSSGDGWQCACRGGARTGRRARGRRGEHGTPATGRATRARISTTGSARGAIRHRRSPASATDCDRPRRRLRDEAAEAPSVERPHLASGRREPAPIELAASHGDARSSAADAPHAFASPWQLPDAAPTAAGGLLFLLPVLERVGFAKWAAERAAGEPAARRPGRADPAPAALAAARGRG